MKQTAKIYALFGDFGLHAGKVAKGEKYNIYFSKYKFEDYFSFNSFTKRRLIIDKNILKNILKEIKNFKVIYFGDSCEAIIFYYILRKLNSPPKIFFINEVDLFLRAKQINEMIFKSYQEDIFNDFIQSPQNNWMYISSAREKKYLNLGIPKENLFYLPVASSMIKIFFPDLRKFMDSNTSNEFFKDKVLSMGSHDRDYLTLVNAVKNTDIKVCMICNPKVRPDISVNNVSWYDSMSNKKYIEAIRNSKYIVIPLKKSQRSAGQMNCAIAMYLGKIVVTTKCESLKDYIITGENGFLCKAEDEKGLHNILKYVEENLQKLKKNMGDKSKFIEKKLAQTAKNNFNNFLNKL